jgi:primosomal protein N' (replication factor Y)
MVSKGLDFESVKLVGIMDADTMLHFPDFRAHERSFQLMAQVSGRAGRKGSRGLVIIQASDHQHPVIQHVINHDYQALFEEQLEERRRFSYPPFSRLVEITLKHRDRDLLDRAAGMLADHLHKAVRETVMGPEYPLVSRIRNQYHKRLLVKMVSGKDLPATKEKIAAGIRVMHELQEFRPVQYTLDVDPY